MLTTRTTYSFGWVARSVEHGMPVEGAAQLWQRNMGVATILGNNIAFETYREDTIIGSDSSDKGGKYVQGVDALVTPRWRVDEAPDAAVAARVERFVAKHGSRVGVLCFGSMQIRAETAVVLREFVVAHAPVIVQQGTSPRG